MTPSHVVALAVVGVVGRLTRGAFLLSWRDAADHETDKAARVLGILG